MVHYPRAWHESHAANPYGAMVTFSPDAAPDAASTRITLQVTAAQPRTRPGDGRVSAPDLVFEAAIGETDAGLVGHRWFVTLYPSGVLIEAYAPPGEFARIKPLAERMVRDIRDSAMRQPNPVRFDSTRDSRRNWPRP